jgi:hypothetical protein
MDSLLSVHDLVQCRHARHTYRELIGIMFSLCDSLNGTSCPHSLLSAFVLEKRGISDTQARVPTVAVTYLYLVI